MPARHSAARPICPKRLSLLVAPAMLLWLAAPAQAQTYAFTDLGILGGNSGAAYGINNSGVVAGGSTVNSGGYHAARCGTAVSEPT